MASSNPIFKEEDLAALEVETEKAAALAKAARRAMNLNILANVVNYSTMKIYVLRKVRIFSVSRSYVWQRGLDSSDKASSRTVAVSFLPVE